MRAATASTETAYVTSETADALNATDSPRPEAQSKRHPRCGVRDTISPTLMNSPRTGPETKLATLYTYLIAVLRSVQKAIGSWDCASLEEEPYALELVIRNWPRTPDSAGQVDQL